MKFKDLNIIEPIMKALKEKGYEVPTPIQEKAIPQILNRKDVLGVAQTGTGKTAAFAIPIIQLIHKKDSEHKGKPVLRSLIVTPTRELAIQIGENIREYAKNTFIKHTVVFGGVKQSDQVRSMKSGVHILIATPGRLLDLIGQGYISLREVKLFVLDEADRMLDMGFIHDINKLIDLLPKQRQSLFFSATMPDNIIELSHKILNNPIKVEVTPETKTADTIQQYMYYTNRDKKQTLLAHIIEDKEIDQALVFSRTKHGADRIARNLKKVNIDASSIHGDKSQPQRQKALKSFKAGRTRVLVATDIAARGIDIDKLKYVINYDVPNEPESYVHRIGRSGRAGEEGVAFSICEPEENEYVRDIEKLIGQKIEVVTENPFPQTDKPMTAAEKKDWQKEKNKRKQEFFANRKSGGKGRGDRSNKPRTEKPRSEKPKHNKPKKDVKAKSNQERPSRPDRKVNSDGDSIKRNDNNSKNRNDNRSENKNNKNAKPWTKKKGRSNTGGSQALKEKYRWPLEK